MTNLPVPVLATEIPGNFVTAALWTTQVQNLGTFLLNRPVFVGTQTVSQSVTTNNWTAISLDTTQVDTYGGHSNSTNNSRYVAQVAGYYTVCGSAAWNNTSSTGPRGSRIHVNGSAIQGTGVAIPAISSFYPAVPTPVRVVYLNVNDYVEVAGFQNSGSALSTTNGLSDMQSSLFVCWSHA